jgi:hypothetical protein
MSESQPLVVRLLGTTGIEQVVPRLAPEVLHRVIEHCGLDACGDIVALATPAQLQRLLDIDLWHPPASGGDDVLDADRFAEWLEMLAEMDPHVAAGRLAAMDTEVVVGGLAQQLRVFDGASVSGYVTLEGEWLEGRQLGDAPHCELGGLVLVSRRPRTWDAVVGLLTQLQAADSILFHRLLRAVIGLSDDARESDGCDVILDDREQQMRDLAIGRDTRRDREGYVAPAPARAFLEAARDIGLDEPRPAVDMVALACLRDLAQASADRETVDPGSSPDDAAGSSEEVARVTAVMEILVDEGLVTPPRALLTAGAPESVPLEHLRAFAASDPGAEAVLAFLVNVLLSGCAFNGRPFTPREAADAAAATCNLGLENWPDAWGARDLVVAFRIGWTLLFRDVCLHTARTLHDVLRDLDSPDRDLQWSLQTLRHALGRELQRGTPWHVRESLDAILSLDACAWAALLALVDECPTLHAALTSQRLLRVDPAAVSFVTRNADIAVARAWVATLGSALQG